jgi:hypothetical protein
LHESAVGTQKTISPAAGGSAYCGAADEKCSRRVLLSMTHLRHARLRIFAAQLIQSTPFRRSQIPVLMA